MKEYFLIFSKYLINGEEHEEPLMRKLSKNERSILIWKQAESAQTFIESNSLLNSFVKMVDKNYLREKANSYKLNGLILKSEIFD